MTICNQYGLGVVSKTVKRATIAIHIMNIHLIWVRDAFKKKKVNFGTLAQKGGGGQSKIPNVDQY